MAGEPLIPNRLKDVRLAVGIETRLQLAAAADIDPAWYEHLEDGRVLPTAAELERLTTALGGVAPAEIYDLAYLSVVPGQRDNEPGYTPSTMFRAFADQCHVLLARDEVAWFERQPSPDHPVDVFLNLSCGTQLVPHLLLDTVAVLEKLDVDFVAAAGSAACCGKPFLNVGRSDVAERVAQFRIDRSVRWGARVHVNWCSACQVTTTTAAARRLLADGREHPIREVQIIDFLEKRVRELGDQVPWRRPVRRRVLVEGHPDYSAVHRDNRAATARLLAMIPGVEVVDVYDGSAIGSPCSRRAPDPGSTPPDWYPRRHTTEGIREHRVWLADQARSRGADTVSCQHQGCHAVWSRYASDGLAVCHAVSILADALDCAHPDRHQAAARLGDPEAFLVQTRPLWESWGISEARARELAISISDPKYADAATQCSCGMRNGCREGIVSIDVLTGHSRPA